MGRHHLRAAESVPVHGLLAKKDHGDDTATTQTEFRADEFRADPRNRFGAALAQTHAIDEMFVPA